jgi:hypothetical protein
MNHLLSTAYLGPIQYFSKFITLDSVIIEGYEHFPKQSYRNRCIIYGANGPLTLTVPVTKNKIKEYTHDIHIDYSTNWQKIHLKALESAYNSSPFFLYYIDEIKSIIQENHTHLFELNQSLTSLLCELIGLTPSISVTTEYINTIPLDTQDFRECIHPKYRMHKTDSGFLAPEYRQVFENKHGFIENLSVIDMLFNMGPNCKTLLDSSIKNS